MKFKFVEVPEVVNDKQTLFNELCLEYDSIMNDACWLTNMHINNITYITDLRYDTRIDDIYLAISSLKAKSINYFIPIHKRYIYHKLDIKTKAIIIGCDEWDKEDFPKENLIDNYSIVEPIQNDSEIDIPQGGAVVLDKAFPFILKKSYENTERWNSIVPLLIEKCKVVILYEKMRRNFKFDPENNFDNLQISKYYSIIHDDEVWDPLEYNGHYRRVVLVKKQ